MYSILYWENISLTLAIKDLDNNSIRKICQDESNYDSNCIDLEAIRCTIKQIILMDLLRTLCLNKNTIVLKRVFVQFIGDSGQSMCFVCVCVKSP